MVRVMMMVMVVVMVLDMEVVLSKLFSPSRFDGQ
jgi:hypothetical protein